MPDMPDVTTAEIQNRITGLKAELDRLAFQLDSAKRTENAPETRPEAGVAPKQNMGDFAPAERQRSLRTLRDLMWQGRWGLAYHLARALEAQGAGEIDLNSSTIRIWALAQDGRRNKIESVQLAEELRRASDSASAKPLATRLLEWATRISVACGVDASQLGMLADRFSPPDELPAACAWWQAYVEALSSAPNVSGKWTRLPDPQNAVAEVDELMLRGELEPVRLAASCLMMSIRRAMRHVHVLSNAEERFILNAELARAATLTFAENGEVASAAAEVERAVCDMANSTSADRTVMITELIGRMDEGHVSSASEGIKVEESLEAPPPRAQAALSRIEAVQQSLESAVGEDRADESNVQMPAQEIRRATAKERLERYAQRIAVQEARHLAVPRDQLVVVPRDEGPFVTQAVANAVEPVVVLPLADRVNRADERPTVNSPAMNQRQRNDETNVPAERDDRRGIHEAALANAFNVDGPNPTQRPLDGGTTWGMMLFNPQAAIVAGLLVIAGAVIIGLGTGLAAKDMTEATTPANEGVEAPEEFAGDLPMVD